MCPNKSCGSGQGPITLIINVGTAPQICAPHRPIQNKISIDLSMDQPQATCPQFGSSSGSQSGDFESTTCGTGSESGSEPDTPSAPTPYPPSPPSSPKPLTPPTTAVQDVDPDDIYIDDGCVPMDIDDVEVEGVSRQLSRVSFDADEGVTVAVEDDGVDEDGDVTMKDANAEEDVDVEMQDVSSL